MFTIDVRFSAPENVVSDIRKTLESNVYPAFRAYANRLLDEQLAGPHKDEPYAIAVDNKPAANRDAINYATRRVRVEFVQSLVEIGLRSMVDALRGAINRRASDESWIQKSRIGSDIVVWYASLDGGKRISASSEITNFRPGEYILLIPNYGTQIFANASKFGAKGFMANAAQSIRSRAKILRSQSVLSVIAGRSRKVLELLPMATRPDGSEIRPTKLERGGWCIIIKYRKVMGANLG